MIDERFTAPFWDDRYRSADRLWSGDPNTALVTETEDLEPGAALDVGSGEGGDAVWLARRGWRVTAVDVSVVGLERGAEHAGPELAGRITWRQADLVSWVPDASWDLQIALMEHLEGAWQQPDNGLWEVRGPRRDFTHSKVMAWVAADRMVDGVRRSGLPGPADRWAALRDTIYADVLAHGFDADRNTFTQSYGSPALDASLLLLGRVGFLPHDDPRIAGTVEAVQRELTSDGLVLRYRPEHSDDGLPGGEGVFLACSFWLVDALVGLGRKTDARALFDRLLDLRNDVGLLSEEYDPTARRHLGNTPQAFSHFPLVTSALVLGRGRPARSDQVPGIRNQHDMWEVP